MLVLALDIATTTGIAVGNAGGAPRAWSHHLGKASKPERFSHMLRLTSDLIEEHKPDLVAVEEPSHGQFEDASLVGLWACAQGVAANRGIEAESWPVPSIRKHFLGRHYTARSFPDLPRAKAKAKIKALVVERCRVLGWGDMDADAADAAALWDFACSKRLGPPLLREG